MGRPIKRKFFGVANANDSLTYSDAGGEGVSSITYTNRGTNYSQGLTATVAVSPIGGTRAVINIAAVSTANGRVDTATVTTAGTGYTTAPAITLVKPANVAVTGQNATYYPDSANLRLSSTSGIYVGMFSNVAGAGTAMITNIYSDGNVRANVSYGNVSASTPINFYDAGVNGSLTAVLAATTVTANTIQANAWTTNGSVGQQADIVSQRSARRYRVTNATETDVCRLVANAAVVSAGGPTGPGEMTITATDSDAGTYLVKKLDSRTATLYPATGTQFVEDQQVVWTSTGSAASNSSAIPTVKIATND